QQIVECCAWNRKPPRFLVHDRDSCYGTKFDRRVRNIGIAQVRTPFRSPREWAIAFVVPYVAVFLAFVVYPCGYALWMVSKPSLYADLIADPAYLLTVVNTLVFVGLGVNLKMFLAFLLSGLFMRRRWWIRLLLAVYVLPWAIATAQACVSF